MQAVRVLKLSSHIIGVLLFLALFVPSSKAGSTTYNYTGNPFNQFGGLAACPPQCNITISFTVATAFGPDANEVGALPLSFVVKDGFETITKGNATSFSFGFFSTNAAGVIIGWNIDALTATDRVYSGTDPLGCTGCHVLDAAYQVEEDPFSFAEIMNSPGSWTTSTSATPEPSSLLLFGTSLLGLVPFRRKLFGR